MGFIALRPLLTNLSSTGFVGDELFNTVVKSIRRWRFNEGNKSDDRGAILPNLNRLAVSRFRSFCLFAIKEVSPSFTPWLIRKLNKQATTCSTFYFTRRRRFQSTPTFLLFPRQHVSTKLICMLLFPFKWTKCRSVNVRQTLEDCHLQHLAASTAVNQRKSWNWKSNSQLKFVSWLLLVEGKYTAST